MFITRSTVVPARRAISGAAFNNLAANFAVPAVPNVRPSWMISEARVNAKCAVWSVAQLARAVLASPNVLAFSSWVANVLP
jgi:hypothetical protein